MAQTRQNVYFSVDRHQLGSMSKKLLFISFQRYVVPSALVHSPQDYRESSLAYLESDLKIIRNSKNWIKALGLPFVY